MNHGHVSDVTLRLSSSVSNAVVKSGECFLMTKSK